MLPFCAVLWLGFEYQINLLRLFFEELITLRIFVKILQF